MPATLPELVQAFGPGLLFAMAFAETALLVGILSPSGTALAIATALAWSEGWGSLPLALLASGTGALAGDSTGYWLGRRGAGRLMQAPGWIGRTLRGYEGLTARLFRRHSAAAVGLGRPIPYVRTLMPVTAGMNQMGYGRFLVFDVLGVGVWVAIYAGIGLVGGRGWRWAADQVGTGWALGAAGFLLAGWLAWLYGVQPGRRARRARQARREEADEA